VLKKFVLLSVFSLTILSSCSQLSPVSSHTFHEVEFNSKGGSLVDNHLIVHNAFIQEPYVEKTGNRLEGWYLSSDGGVTLGDQWDFDSDRVTNSFTLFASWSVNQYTITFNSNGGTNVSSITRNYGASISKPTNPTRSNYTFENWYRDSSLSESFFFSTMPAENLTLYAKWNVASSVNVNSITFTYDKIGVAIRETFQMEATVSPSNATNKSLSWTSSNTNVATVSSLGLITGKAFGTAIIRATSVNGIVQSATLTVFYNVDDKIINESESNNSRSLADSIPFNGTTIYGSNSSKSDLDYFSVYLTSGSYFTVIFAPEYSIDKPYFLIGILNSTTTLTAIYGSSEYVQYYVTVSATYYVLVAYSTDSPYSSGDGYGLFCFWF